MTANNSCLNQAMDFQFTTMSIADSTDEEWRLREDLNYFFMNPCEKYRARRQFPWKLCLQVLKIVMVTTQLILFGLSNQLVASFKEESSIAFKHLFLKGYQDTDKNEGSFALYTQQDVYDSVSYSINQVNYPLARRFHFFPDQGQHLPRSRIHSSPRSLGGAFLCNLAVTYLQLQSVTVGNYAYDTDTNNKTSLQVCKQLYERYVPVTLNDKLAVTPMIETDCLNIEPSDPPIEWKISNSSFFDLEFYRLIALVLSFKLKGIDLQTIHNNELPDCYEFGITITFNNAAHSGIIRISLDSHTASRECKDWEITGSFSNTHCILIFDGCVMLVCLMSLILCTRSIILALKLHKTLPDLPRFSRVASFGYLRFITFFMKRNNKKVCSSDRLEFLNGWYILIIISDLMTITGSIMKIEITAKNLTTYDVCSIFLGTSTLFAWVGVIRYLGYFQTYNVLILTMRGAFPKVLRFCCCAGMIYLGYMFCGWIVLGPYHSKFEKLSAVAECLFSLVNGDDMFATFAELQEKSNLLWVFSRIYLYSFISLFIYMVLSLFIALITDTYETIKKYQLNGFPKTDLRSFMEVGSVTLALSRQGNDDRLLL